MKRWSAIFFHHLDHLARAELSSFSALAAQGLRLELGLACVDRRPIISSQPSLGRRQTYPRTICVIVYVGDHSAFNQSFQSAESALSASA
mmetsp:Transcript_1796/g.3994  ORF Transcript_1796/g.3994 Transcript_1796/m.3994 type:complete len:90 (-) Transcript_1796:2-271(-)